VSSNVAVLNTGGALAMQEDELIQVLQSSLYPGAALASIKLVIGYCKAAGLDPMQKPVHIVPMWDSKAKQMRDVIMPGVGLYRTQAARAGCAGVTEPEYGPDVSETIGGQKITFPQWCRVTVKRRQPSGDVDEFTAREFWIENYAVKGGAEKSIAPNAMWTKRPYGQLAKCAEAQALRKAFPENGSQPAAEEMEGKAIQADEALVIDAPPQQPAPIPWPDEAFSAQMIRWDKAVAAGLKMPADILAMARSKGALSAAQEALINALRKAEAPAAEIVEPGWGDDSMKKEEGGQA
jgi:phage recombination protein Bet